MATNPHPGNATAAKRQFAVTVAGIPWQFAKFTGGESSAAVSEAWNGGADSPDNTAGPRTISNIVVGRPFNPARDRPVIKKYEHLVGMVYTTIVKQDLDSNKTRVGSPKTYTRCLLIRVSEPEMDAAASEHSDFEMEFKPTNSI